MAHLQASLLEPHFWKYHPLAAVAKYRKGVLLEIWPHRRSVSDIRMQQGHIGTPCSKVTSGLHSRFLSRIQLCLMRPVHIPGPHPPAALLQRTAPATETLPGSTAWRLQGSTAPPAGTVAFVGCQMTRSATLSQYFVTLPGGGVNELWHQGCLLRLAIFRRFRCRIVVTQYWKGALLWECWPTENRAPV
jgi:hypothetical protein